MRWQKIAIQAGQKNTLLQENSLFAWSVKKEKIAENGEYNLTGDRYREVVDYSNAKWEMVELGELLEERREKVGKDFEKYITCTISSIHKGFVDQKDYFEKKVASENRENYKIVKRGWIGYRPPGLDIGTIGLQNLDDQVIVSPLYAIFEITNNLISSKYLIKILQSENFKEVVKPLMLGSARPLVSSKDFIKIQIPLPSLEVQEQIVAEIKQYQKVIDGAKQVVENWKPSFRINPSWEMLELGEVGKVSMCKRVFKDQTLDKGDVPFYKIGTFGRTPDAFIKQKLFDEYKSKFSYPKKGEILISTSGTIGKTVVFDGEPAYFQDSNIVWIENNEKKVLNKYLNLIYQNINWMPTKGGTIARLYNKIIEETKIIVPPLEVQEQIVAEVEAEQKAIDECKKLIEKMEKKIEAKIGEVWGDEI